MFADRKNHVQHPSHSNPREEAIKSLTLMAEVFLENAILTPIHDTYLFLSPNKQSIKNFCTYLRNNWEALDRSIIESYLNKLIDEQYPEVKKLIEYNITIYSCIRLRIEGLRKVKLDHAESFKQPYFKYIFELLSRYKKISGEQEKFSLSDSIKSAINGFYVVPPEEYSLIRFRENVNQNQYFLIKQFQTLMGKIEKFIPYNFRNPYSEKIEEFLQSIELEKKVHGKAVSFTSLSILLNDYLNRIKRFDVVNKFVLWAQKLIKLVTNLEQLKERAETLNLKLFQIGKVPEYQVEYLDLDAHEIISAWETLADLDLRKMKPLSLSKIDQESKKIASETKGERKDEMKDEMKAEQVPSSLSLQPTPIEIPEEKKAVNGVREYPDSPFLAKRLDDATLHYLIKLYQMLPRDNGKLAIVDVYQRSYSLRQLAKAALSEYRASGLVSLQLLRGAFKRVAEYYQLYRREGVPKRIKSALDFFEKLTKTIKAEAISKNDPYPPAFFVRKADADTTLFTYVPYPPGSFIQDPTPFTYVPPPLGSFIRKADTTPVTAVSMFTKTKESKPQAMEGHQLDGFWM